MSTLHKIGIIGAGTITGNHVKGLKNLAERTKIVAICDINTEAAENLARDFNAVVYTDYNEMLDSEELDICLVCLPHGLHICVGLDILKKGVALFLEKPMALDKNECRQLMDAAEKNGKTIFVGQTHQYRSVLRKAKELIQNGAIGEPKAIFTEIIAYYNWENRKPWFLDPKMAGHGVLFNTAPHQVDHLLFLIDSPIVKVRGHVSALRPGQTIASDSFAFVEYANGVQGVFSCLAGTRLEEPARLSCKILGTKGSIQFNPFKNEIQLAKMDKVEIVECEPNDPFAAEWIECLDTIEEGRPGRTDAVYGHNVVAVLEAIIKSSDVKQEVDLDLL
ncbi:MAG: Gfo/Idh/MocA family oxidoreductase [bacterium]